MIPASWQGATTVSEPITTAATRKAVRQTQNALVGSVFRTIRCSADRRAGYAGPRAAVPWLRMFVAGNVAGE